MKRVGKIVAGFFFILFFLLLLVVGTFRFEVLNAEFVFSSLERNGIYTKLPSELAKALPNDPNMPKEEKGDYAKIVSSIPPSQIKNLLEKNLLSIFNFLNGSSKDVVFSIPASDLGVPGVENISWSLFKNSPKETVERLQVVYGIGNKLIFVCVVLIIVLILLFLVVGRSILLIIGILVLLLGGVGKFFLLIISSNTLLKPEPSQVLLGFLSSSILSDIAISWLILGAVFIMIWFFLKKQNRFS